ncbi:MAG: ATP-binding protein [Spirochaetaceae bacterium]|jgi:predicted AAA+ superfamily ATPase|nr:ATP-binding protein [Spirochaetaceae bacterium]
MNEGLFLRQTGRLEQPEQEEPLARLIRDARYLAVFANIKRHPMIRALLAEDGAAFVEAVVNFLDFNLNAESNYCFADALANLVLYDDNPFTRAAAQTNDDAELPPVLVALAKNELSALSRIARLDGSLIAQIGEMPKAAHLLFGKSEGGGPNAVFPFGEDWGKRFAVYTAFLRKNGTGVFAQHHAFVWDGAAFRAATHPDPVTLSDLTLFEDQRQVVVSNTKRFLEGRAANNILLYGDRGTGKSATVKAVANTFAKSGLRIVEVSKAHLADLPAITARLQHQPLKFILFIDDLSFEAQGDSFTHLKGLLEGGVEARPANIVVYATSNRRHLVKEKFADRPAGGGIATGSEADVRAFDTMQEQLSLSDRFGVTVVFTAPDQDAFLKIAEFIAEERGLLNPLTVSDAELQTFRDNALRWERWFNGRSPRTARQFVDWLEGGEEFPWVATPLGN